MTARQRITTSFGSAILAGGLVAAFAVSGAGAGAPPEATGFHPGATTLVLEKQPAPDAETLAREGMAKMLQALNKLVDSIPQYQLPEITENGDIILRRKRPSEPQPSPTQKRPSGEADNRAI